MTAPVNQQPETSTSKQKSRQKAGSSWRRQGLRVAILLSVLLLLVWQRQRVLAPFFHSQAEKSLQDHDPQNALAWLRHLKTLSAETARTALISARAYRQIGDMKQVAEFLAMAQRGGIPEKTIRREQILAYAQSGQLKQAEPHLAELLTDTSNSSTEVSESFVIGYTRAQQFGKGLKILEAWLADANDDPQPYLLRGRIYLLQDKFEEARQDYETAVRLKPGLMAAHFELAESLRKLNQVEKAAEHYELCLQDQQLGVPARVGLADCLTSLGDFRRSLQLLEEASKLAPENPLVLKGLGQASFEQGDYAAAEARLKEALGVTPQDDEVHYTLAQALQLLGQVDEAREHFDYVKEARAELGKLPGLKSELLQNPGSAETLFVMGKIVLKYGDPEEGVVYLLNALDLNPNLGEARQLLFEHFQERARRDPAYEDLARQFSPH